MRNPTIPEFDRVFRVGWAYSTGLAQVVTNENRTQAKHMRKTSSNCGMRSQLRLLSIFTNTRSGHTSFFCGLFPGTVISAIVMLGDAFSAKEGPLIWSTSVDRVFPTQPESRAKQREKTLRN